VPGEAPSSSASPRAPAAGAQDGAGEATSVTNDRRPLVLAFLMTTMTLGSIEGTIVATAMPSIASALGGFELYAWVFAAYLLTQAVSTPIVGRLADSFGRKPLLIASIAVFLAASVACGFADSMPLLIALRFFQGFGAGGIFTTVVTLAGDLYTVRERGRIQAYLASVWGVSAIVGPLLGGLIVTNFDWAWVFWFSVPFGIASIVGLSKFLVEKVDHRVRRPMDWPGAALLMVAMTGLMLLLNQGSDMPRDRMLVIGALTLGAAVVLARRLSTRDDSILPLGLWRDRLILLANLSGYTAGILMIGLITYVPPYVQGVMGYAPLVAGFALSTMSLGWPLASTTAGRLLIPIGPARTAQLGGLAGLLGGTMFLFATPDLGPWWVAASSFLVGIGLGFINTSSIVSIQAVVSWDRRATATAGNMLMRLLGNSLGAAMLGGVLNAGLVRRIAEAGPGSGLELAAIERLLSPEGVPAAGPAAAAVPGAGLELLRATLAGGLHEVFIAAFIAAVVLFALTLLWPAGRRLE